MSIADQIEKIGRALTAGELSRLLSVSKVTIFKQAAAGRIPSLKSALAALEEGAASGAVKAGGGLTLWGAAWWEIYEGFTQPLE